MIDLMVFTSQSTLNTAMFTLNLVHLSDGLYEVSGNGGGFLWNAVALANTTIPTATPEIAMVLLARVSSKTRKILDAGFAVGYLKRNFFYPQV